MNFPDLSYGPFSRDICSPLVKLFGTKTTKKYLTITKVILANWDVKTLRKNIELWTPNSFRALPMSCNLACAFTVPRHVVRSFCQEATPTTWPYTIDRDEISRPRNWATCLYGLGRFRQVVVNPWTYLPTPRVQKPGDG